ncbi:MAG: hypothetical protein KGZ68_12525 [Dechloromonas sp.]|nr:hypothetical protein [Dechloromonas sp.]
MSKKASTPAEKPAADEFDGQGGSYVVDPETGKKTLVERTRPADEVKEKQHAAVES